MKQVTYKEAKLSFIEIRNGNDDIELVKTVLDYMHQHKPPTWEEVVEAWEVIGFLSYDSSDHIALLFIDYQKNEVAFEYIKQGRFNVSIEKINTLYPAMLNAINLATRYLEAQKHHDL